MPYKSTDAEEWPAQPLVELENPFVDARGEIKPLTDITMKSAMLITSKAGSLRANHYHKTDWHYCYVLSGTMEYFHRPHGSEEEPERLLIETGQMVFTPPLVDHAVKFPVDTVFLALTRNPRDQGSYEDDLVRIELVKADQATIVGDNTAESE